VALETLDELNLFYSNRRNLNGRSGRRGLRCSTLQD